MSRRPNRRPPIPLPEHHDNGLSPGADGLRLRAVRVITLTSSAWSPGVRHRSHRTAAIGTLPLLGDQVEHIVLHVFSPGTTPAMLDRPVRDMIILGEQFLARHLPTGSRIEMHVGPVARRVAEMAASHDADLVVLSWSQPTGEGRAQTVMEVLAGSAVPVLLVPNIPAGSEPVEWRSRSHCRPARPASEAR